MSKGQKYNAAPTLTIIGDGIGAVITPVFENNEITEIKVIHGGNGYSSASTSISVDFPGSGINVKPILQSWRVNLFERNLANVSGDDGYIAHEFRPDLGLQYSHLYAPRVLRESVFANSQEGDPLYGDKDLQIVNGLEVASNQHSPIIGWAYDGHPIYGPYGYVTQSGGVITQMKSGYSLDIAANRPPTTLFPDGFFVEDFTYKNVADETILDENNGRYCVTPEFPDGTYAYFAAIDSGATESAGPFAGFKKPTFPYLIGDNYRSIPNDFNFKYDSNQDEYDLQNSGWQRNTQPYNLIEGDTEYDYVYIPNKLSQTIDIKSVVPGSVEKIGIETGGVLYQVGDAAIFDNTDTSGKGAVAKVSTIVGKTVESISVATSSITGIEVYPGTNQGDYLLVSDNPHNFTNKDIIDAIEEDINEIYHKDPACNYLFQPLLFYKGFQALQAYRVANYWAKEKLGFSMYIQSIVSEKFNVDIHPNAKIGKGIMIDHASGVVIGETAIVGDYCSIFHGVTSVSYTHLTLPTKA